MKIHSRVEELEVNRAIKIPVLADQVYRKYFHDRVLVPEMSHLIVDPSTATHSFVLDIGNILYQIGASLVNTGTAYSGEIMREGRLQEVPFNYNAADNNHKQAALMIFYDKLISTHANQIAGIAKNLYKFLLIVKIALDHFPSEIIAKIFILIESFLRTTMPVDKIIFPNGAEFNDANFMFAVMVLYINSNTHKFVNTVLNRNCPYYILGERDPSRLIALFNLDMRQELDKMLAISGPDGVLARSCYFFSRRSDEQSLFLIEEEKKLIVATLSAYVSINKLSYFTRTNTNRASTLISNIQNATMLREIDNYLAEQEEFLNGKNKSQGWKLFSWMAGTEQAKELTEEEKEHSGFYKSVKNARTLFNKIIGRAEEQVLAVTLS